MSKSDEEKYAAPIKKADTGNRELSQRVEIKNKIDNIEKSDTKYRKKSP